MYLNCLELRAHSTARKTSGRRDALATVEFAFVAPVLFVLVFGSIDFGRAMMVANLLTTTAREGCRRGITPNAVNSEVTGVVNSQIASMGIAADLVTTSIKVNGATADCATAISGDTIQVTVSVPFNNVSWLPTSYFLKDATLKGAASMRRE